MGLVDYSDSDSDSEAPQKKGPARPDVATQNSSARKPAPKLLNRSATGKILVNLPSAASTSADTANNDDGPPAKRARTGDKGNTKSRFSGFSSFLPPPKNPNASKRPAPASEPSGAGSHVDKSSQGRAPQRIGLYLKTSAEAAFSRDEVYDDLGEGDASNETGGSSGLGGLKPPPPKAAARGPTIPEGQIPEEEVKLVGKPLMFRPLSVGRKPIKKKDKSGLGLGIATTRSQGAPTTSSGGRAPVAAPEVEAPKKKKVSLFSVADEEEATTSDSVDTSGTAGAYEPLFPAAAPADEGLNEDYQTVAQNAYMQQAALSSAQTARPQGKHDSLSSIADELNLTAKERRELFGRNGGNNIVGVGANARVVSFNMEREYAANEALRASGEQVMHNPVRSIAPGKHSLRQVVNMVQNNQDALEESFARQRTNRNEAAGRYGWK